MNEYYIALHLNVHCIMAYNLPSLQLGLIYFSGKNPTTVLIYMFNIYKFQADVLLVVSLQRLTQTFSNMAMLEQLCNKYFVKPAER